MSNKYLEKIAMFGISPDTKKELAQTASVGAAGVAGTLATNKIGQMTGLLPKVMEKGHSAKLGLLGGAIGLGADYAAVKINRKLEKTAKIQIDKKNKGLLHKKLGLSPGKKIPSVTLSSAKSKAKKSGNVKLEREVVFAQNAKKWNHK